MLEIVAAALGFLAVELLLLVLAWKLRRGQWLRLIAGNTFASPEEMERPYQKRMGRDVSNVLVLCAVGLLFLFGLACFAEGGFSSRVVAGAAVVFCVLILAASVAVSVRSRRAAREEDRRAGLPEPSESERRLDRSQTIVVLVLVAVMLGISLAGAFLAS